MKTTVRTAFAGLCGLGCAATHLDVGQRATIPDPDESFATAPSAPPFTLTAHTGEAVSLYDALRTGPVVLVFYRGHWCPWCRRQLGEFAYEHAALRSRGVRLLALSVDKRADSVAFAQDHQIPFPLLEDAEGLVSRQYVGLDVDGSALPGVVIINARGEVVARRVGEGAADRVLAPELLELVADSLREGRNKAGTREPRSLRGGYSPLTRLQLRSDAGGGAAQNVEGDADWTFSTRLAGSALYPFGRFALLGPLLRGGIGDAALVDLDVAPKLRIPLLGDIAEAYLLTPAGVTLTSVAGWNVGAHLGAQFAITPSLAIYYQAGGTYYRFSADDTTDELRYVLDLGIAFLPAI